MASVNKVILVGNVGRDPEVRRMNSGDAVVKTGSQSRGSAHIEWDIKETSMPKFNFASATATLATVAVAALAITLGSAAPAKADAPFCSENYSRTGQGRVCAYYTYDQCRVATSGVGAFAQPPRAWNKERLDG